MCARCLNEDTSFFDPNLLRRNKNKAKKVGGEQRSSKVNENASISQPTSSVLELTNSSDRKSEFVAKKIEEKLLFPVIDDKANPNAPAITFPIAIALNLVSGKEQSPADTRTETTNENMQLIQRVANSCSDNISQNSCYSFIKTFRIPFFSSIIIFATSILIFKFRSQR